MATAPSARDDLGQIGAVTPLGGLRRWPPADAQLAARLDRGLLHALAFGDPGFAQQGVDFLRPAALAAQAFLLELARANHGHRLALKQRAGPRALVDRVGAQDV